MLSAERSSALALRLLVVVLQFRSKRVNTNCTSSLQVPRAREQDLVNFLQQLEKSAKDLGITDTQLSLASLVSW